MRLLSFDAVQEYYLKESQRVVDTKRNPVILKTDLYNEANAKPLPGGIIGNLKNYRKIYGLEFQKETVEMAARNLPQEPDLAVWYFDQGDIRELPYANKVFDIVIDLSTLDHIPPVEVPKVLKEYKRVLKAAGVCFLITWIDLNGQSGDAGWNPNNQYFFDEEKLIKQIQEVFRITEMKEIFIHPNYKQWRLYKFMMV